jgi:hypothetical protein
MLLVVRLRLFDNRLVSFFSFAGNVRARAMPSYVMGVLATIGAPDVAAWVKDCGVRMNSAESESPGEMEDGQTVMLVVQMLWSVLPRKFFFCGSNFFLSILLQANLADFLFFYFFYFHFVSCSCY